MIDAAIGVIAERGIRSFSLAETSRRLGVTVAAPYSHFTDRDELLVAVAQRAVAALAASLAAEISDARTATARLAAAARGYVRFASVNRPLFEVLFGAGLNKHDHPELEEAAQQISEHFLKPAHVLCPAGVHEAENLALTVATAAHGHATLLLDGAFGTDDHAVHIAMTRAADTARAIILGRKAITGTPRPQ
ncbi:TetR/AcrR family transcriptional regulator [Dactylosporangium sp. CA-092794]|uniref:TetR/AcrR family transcriptional regulator n=1 Tax=Dactylosporangium sp. CA-092794 TaxID=3239929 RepID=UPI003D8C1EF6